MLSNTWSAPLNAFDDLLNQVDRSWTRANKHNDRDASKNNDKRIEATGTRQGGNCLRLGTNNGAERGRGGGGCILIKVRTA